MTTQDLTAILKKSIPTPMNSKQRAEREICQTEREIENLNNKLQEQKEALQNIDKPRYVYEAECGDEMYDGCILISRIANRDECWAILGAPLYSIENQDVTSSNIEQQAGQWFLPTLEIIKSLSYEEFPIPHGHYLTSTRCTETGRLMVFVYIGTERSRWYPAEFNTLYKIWLVKLVKCKTHYSQNDSDYSY